MAEATPNRIVITVLGKNRPGIVAAISRVLGEEGIDIRDITQSIIEDIFTMTMIADMAASTPSSRSALPRRAKKSASTCRSSAKTSSTSCTASRRGGLA